MNQSNKLIELVKDIALETGQENLPKELVEISEECNKLEESLNTASNMQEIEDIIDEKESDFRFQIDWTRYVFENVEQLLKAKTDEKLTKYRLSHLMDVKTKKEIHDKIWVKEFYANGLKHMNNADIKIVNLRIRKCEKKVIADIIQKCECVMLSGQTPE